MPTGACEQQRLEGRGFRDVCAFIARLADAGVEVECTGVNRPDVEVRLC